MKLSIYFYLFNAELRQFELDQCINNFCSIADEVVCATIPSEDNTLERLKLHEKEKGKDLFKVIESNVSLSDNRFDGKLKTVALKGCKQNDNKRLYCIMDADEYIPLSNKSKWENWGELLLKSSLDGLLIPVIDLFKDKDSIRADRDIGQKFRLHKNTVTSRGVIPQAERQNGFIDHTMSDTTEPLNFMGDLANFQSCVSPGELQACISFGLSKYPYVIHTGSLDISRRAKINKEFWKQHWQNRTVETINDIVTEERELIPIKTIRHSLALK